jgi:hypothetical protein
MARVLRILLAAAIGLFALIAGLFGAVLLLVAGLLGLVRKPKIHVATAGTPPRPPSTRPGASDDVIDVETTKVETKRELP